VQQLIRVDEEDLTKPDAIICILGMKYMPYLVAGVIKLIK